MSRLDVVLIERHRPPSLPGTIVAVRPLLPSLLLLLLGCGAPDRPKVFVTDELSGTLSVIDRDRLLRRSIIELADDAVVLAPHNVQVAPDGLSVWVTAPPKRTGGGGSPPLDQVVVLDPRTEQVKARLRLGPGLGLAHVVLDDASRYAFVTAYSADQIIQLDAKAFTEVRRYPLKPGRGPHGARVCGDRLFVANMLGRSLTVVEPGSGFVQEVPLDGVAVQSACTRDGRFVYVSLYDRRAVVRFEPATGELVRFPLPAGAQGPIQIYLTPDESRLYVCDQGLNLDRPPSNKLYELDLARGLVSATIDVGLGAHGVVVDERGERVFVTNMAAHTVSVVEVSGRRTIATLPVGQGPSGIAEWHVSGGMR